MQSLSWKDSIAARLLIRVFQYYIFITIIVTLAHMMMDFSFTKDIIKKDLEVFHTSFEPGLSVALWNQEDEALHASLLAIYQVPQISGAKIIDDSGEFVTAVGSIREDSGEIFFFDPNTLVIENTSSEKDASLFSYSKKIYHTEDGTKYHIGQLILYSSDSIVFSQVQYSYLFIVINSIIKTMALWAIVLWQSKPLIYEPLKKISEKLSTKNVHNLEEPTFKIKNNENSELLMLKSSINDLFSVLASTFKERDSALKEVNMRNEELSQFSYRTSHDLKAPLVTVRKLSDFIVQDINNADYDDVKENAAVISKNVHKLENLVTDILSLAKADLEISEKEAVNLWQIIEEIQQRLKGIYIDSETKIENTIDESIEILVSKARITQIIENLMSNAIKYRDENKPFQLVKVSINKKGLQNTIVIEDNGIGIPEKFQEKVFEMFQRFHPEISFGSGLGMYIVKKHIEKMSAEISFKSSNQGTRFEITLTEDNGKLA